MSQKMALNIYTNFLLSYSLLSKKRICHQLIFHVILPAEIEPLNKVSIRTKSYTTIQAEFFSAIILFSHKIYYVVYVNGDFRIYFNSRLLKYSLFLIKTINFFNSNETIFVVFFVLTIYCFRLKFLYKFKKQRSKSFDMSK